MLFWLTAGNSIVIFFQWLANLDKATTKAIDRVEAAAKRQNDAQEARIIKLESEVSAALTTEKLQPLVEPIYLRLKEYGERGAHMEGKLDAISSTLNHLADALIKRGLEK